MNERTLLRGHLAEARSTEARLEAEIAAHAASIRSRLDKYVPIEEWSVAEAGASMEMLTTAHEKLLAVKARIRDLKRDLGE